MRGSGFSTTLVRLFILRWALTLVALLASGAAGAAVPETQPARVQGGDATGRNASRNAQPKSGPVAGRRVDASCDGSDGDAACDGETQIETATLALWQAHQLLFLQAELAFARPSFEAPTVDPRVRTRRPAWANAVPVRPVTRDVLQPRAPPRD